MKNEVRPIDANATIEALRANFQQGSWYGCEDPLYQVAEDTIAEMPTVILAPSGEPLTMEQLREMDGQPVWVTVLDTRFNEENQWAICNADYQMVTLKDGFKLFFCGYESNWLAYTYPPAHIDREAFGCPYCTPDANGYVRKFGAFSIHNGMLETGHCKPQEIKYCPHCSRPLTEEAWAELEKRMGV